MSKSKSRLVINTSKESGFRWEVPDVGAIFLYHKMTTLERQTLLQSHMVNGKLPRKVVMEVAYCAMEQMIDDWENVEDEHGKVVKFDTKYIRGIDVDTALLFVDEIIFE